MRAYARQTSQKVTGQMEEVLGKNQVKNEAGGYVFELDKWKKLDRFLILGTEGGTYYATEKKMTKEAANCVVECIAEDGSRLVNRVVEISKDGRAPKNDPALFVLALALKTGNLETRRAASAALNDVARIGTHLFTFAENIKHLGGWGRLTRKTIAGWYNGKETSNLAFQMAKYQQRNGWSHKDLIRLAHIKETNPARAALFQWAGAKYTEKDFDISSFEELHFLHGMEELAMLPTDEVEKAAELIQEYHLPRECIPTEFLNSPAVWKAMLPSMGLTAMIRNLGVMTSNGTLVPMAPEVEFVNSRLRNPHELKKARIHPVDVLAALTVYGTGAGVRGSKTWEPIQTIKAALDDAFYLSFGNVEPTGKRILIGLDVSGSMTCGEIAGKPGLTPRNASVAMCLVTAAVEKNYQLMAFSDTFIPLDFTAKTSLEDAVRKVDRMGFSSTDCSLPMIYAARRKMEVDAFIVYTDSETWSGSIHPFQALKMYRRDFVKDAKLIVVAMTSNGFTIADPTDAGMMDVVGFDTATPQLMSDFINGKV